MPIYEYRCPSCGTKFELLRSMSRSDESATCPEGHDGGRRLISVFASFAKDESGEMSSIAGGGSSCADCGGGSCSTCF